MKVIIAGGRDYHFNNDDIAFLDWLHKALPITEVVSGCCSGADNEGLMWAITRGIRESRFPANWCDLGRKAGPIRNTQMAGYADAAILFPGGTGTADMKRKAERRNLLIIERDDTA